LLISIDTLRAEHLGCYGDGHGLTPHLDRLAAQGTLFEHAITSSPWTLPAMASLFTGLYPSRHGAGEITNRRDPLGRSPLPPNTRTLTSVLSEAGYRTHASATNPYLALRYGFGEGFETYENVTIESEAFLSFEKTTAVRLLKWIKPEWITGDRGETVSARAHSWLQNYDRSRPFFLWLHYVDPHPPYSRPGVRWATPAARLLVTDERSRANRRVGCKKEGQKVRESASQPLGLNLGSVISGVTSSNTTSTGIPMCTEAGSHSTTFVSMRTPSSRSTWASTYGSSSRNPAAWFW
jgi:arylsulfatase A-like enzyme